MIGTTANGDPARPWRVLPAPRRLGLWLVDLAQPPDRAALAQLTEREWVRAARFHNPADRHCYVTAHAAVRGLIAIHCGLALACQQFDWTIFGKWRLAGAVGWDFSLSYAGDTALVGIAKGCAVGVDLERRRSIPDARALARLHFTQRECAALAGLSAGDRDAVFLRGWTRKEACVKALGTGLSIGLAAPLTELETGVYDGCCTARYGDLSVTVGSATMIGPSIGTLIGAWALVPPQ